MLRKIVCSAAIVAFAVGFGFAEEIRAVITKVDGNNITFAEVKGKGGDKGPEKTMSAAGAKINKGKFNQDTKKLEADGALEGGLGNAAFKKIDEKGVRATVITEGTKITEIRVGGGRGKKN